MGRRRREKAFGFLGSMHDKCHGLRCSFRARIPRFFPPPLESSILAPSRENARDGRSIADEEGRRRGGCREDQRERGVSLLLDGGTCPCKLTSTAIATILAHGPPFWTSTHAHPLIHLCPALRVAAPLRSRWELRASRDMDKVWCARKASKEGIPHRLWRALG